MRKASSVWPPLTIAAALVCCLHFAKNNDRSHPTAAPTDTTLPAEADSSQDLGREGGRHARSAALVASSARESSQPPPLRAPQSPASVGASQPPGRALVNDSHALLAGQLVDDSGQVLAGARLTWTPLVDELCAPEALVSDVSPERIAAFSVSATSDASGAFRFDRSPPGLQHTASVIWITHAAYAATPVLLAAAPRAWPDDLNLTAQRARQVAVVDAQGEPVVGARVVQRALCDPSHAHGALPQRALTVFTRVSTTGPDGRVDATLPAFGSGYALLAAEFEQLSSPPVVAVASEPDAASDLAQELVLTLHPKFSVRGQVRFKTVGLALAAPHAELLSGSRIAVGALRAGEFVPLGSLRVASDGTFGPRDFALLPGEGFAAELFPAPEATRALPAGLQATRVERATLSADSIWELSFEAAPATQLEIVVVDLQEGALPNTLVSAWWESDEGLRTQVSASTDDEGRATLERVRPGLVWIEASAQGYATRTAGPVLAEEVREATSRQPATRVQLSPRAALLGRCTHGGHALTSFDVAWWSGAEPTPTLVHFEDARDGAFELIDIPEGELWVTAFSDHHPAPRAELVEVSARGLARLEIELPRAADGLGYVIDRATGEPLAGARVRAWATAGERWVAPRAASALSLGDGSFELASCGTLSTGLEVSAPGYATSWTICAPHGDGLAAAQHSGHVALGSIALERAASARILVRGAGANHAARELSGLLAGANSRALPAFTASAEGAFCELDDLRPFPTTFRITTPDGTTRQQQVALRADETTEVLFELAGERSLLAHLVRVEDGRERRAEVRSGLARLSIRSADGTTELVLEQALVNRTELLFSELPDGPHAQQAVLEILEGDRTRAARVVQLASGTRTLVDIALDHDARRLRVVDSAGQPLPGTRVELRLASEPDTGWRFEGRTDLHGELTWGPLELAVGAQDTALSAALTHPELGSADRTFLAQPSDLDDPARVDLLVLDPPLELNLLLTDAGLPQPAVALWLVGPDGTWRADATTDATGLAAFGPFAPGTWYAFVQQPGYWELPMEFSLSPGDASPIEIPVFGLGAAHFEVLRDGAPAVDATIDLSCSSPFAAGLEAWMASEGVPALAAGIRTDAQGTVEVPGLPRGTWTYEVTSSDGQPLGQGEFTVLAQATTSVSMP